jgi:TnsA endonuclease N terminal/TnsA endonuclease C terminal
MAKRQTGWTEKKIARYFKEGRGQGELSNYKPWLTIQDVPSRGRVHRETGWTSKRIHHLLSDLEYSYLCLLDWFDEVIDVREQYPLNREKTIHMAEQININHPMDPKTKTPIVMTTDFFITLRKDNDISYLARTIKPRKELNDSRVIEKFELERLYWEQEGVDWGIVTEDELPEVLIENIKWLRSSHSLSDSVDSEFIFLLAEELRGGTIPILDLLKDFDMRYKLEGGTSLFLFRHMLATKIIKMDMLVKIDLMLPVSSVIVVSDYCQEGRMAT